MADDVPYANVRQMLGHLIGKKLEDITQHDEDDWRRDGKSFVCLMFEGGGTIEFPIESTFSYTNPEEPNDE